MPLTVLIVDNTSAKRRESIAEAIHRAAVAHQIEVSIYHWNGRDKRLYPNQSKPVDLPAKFDLTVLHHVDQPLLEELPCQRVCITLYTGVDPPKKVGWINRPVNEDNPLTESEAYLLLQWCKSLRVGKETEFPELLRPVGSCELLMTLELICQTALAISTIDPVDPDKSFPGSPICRQALRLMGWQFTQQQAEALFQARTSLGQEKIPVQFLLGDELLSLMGARGLAAAVAEEWGVSVPESIAELVSCISTDSPLQIEAVAHAYCALNERLNGPSGASE
jgi:hypothetical protein